MSKKIVNLLQNIALVVLSVTAVLLLLQFPMLEGAVTGRMRAFLSPKEQTVEKSFDLSGAITAVHFAVTDDYEYGRCTRINANTADADFQKLSPLLREAIGSASDPKKATETELRAALKSAGIYIDLTTTLPVSVVSAWLGEDASGEYSVRAMALTTVQETAKLYFLKEDGTVVRCESALSSAAVREITATFTPNGGRFAYETEYTALAPYTVLVQEVDTVAQVNASIPDGYSAYNLLTVLDFNAHTNSRYTESGGTEVVMQSPRTLKIGPDGTVHYSSDGEVTDELYRIPCAGETPTDAEVLYGVCVLANALVDGTKAATLSLDKVEPTENGWIFSFCYRVNGVRVRLSDDRDALHLVVNGNTITEFTYYCRVYTPTADNSELLPPRLAVAVAAMQDGAELAMAYVDNGNATLGAHWFAQ